MHIYIHEHLSLTFGQGLKIILKFDIAYPQKIILSLILRAKSTSAIRKKKVIARAQDINPVLIASQIKIPLGKSLFTWKVREKREKNIWNASHLGETFIYNLRRMNLGGWISLFLGGWLFLWFDERANFIWKFP